MSALLAGGLALLVVATSFLSGIFGMAGGLILLGALLAVLDVAPAMVLFGTTQLASNGWRGVLWRAHVRWPLVWRYTIGSVVAFLAMRLVAFLPGKALVYLGLGLMPFAVELLPGRLSPDITRPGAPFICGAAVMVLQLLAGASGNVLDVFFQKSPLDRKAIVATKAVTQVLAHALRIAYFGSFAQAFDAHLPWWIYAGAVGLAIAGTTLAASLLHAMTDIDFRRWSRWVIKSVSLTYAARGSWLLLTGSTT